MITVANLIIFSDKKTKTPLLQNVNFCVEEEECFGIIGPSGCGKSTLLRTVCSLHPYWRGDIALSCPRHQIQMVFQDPLASLHPRHTVYEILREPLIIQRVPYHEDVFVSALDEVSLSVDFLFRYPHQLSGGQRQRVSIARSLLLKPKILLLDECTSALDASVQKDILLLLKRLQKERKMTCLLVSHHPSVIHFMCPRFFDLRTCLHIWSG